jgi:glyoxylase-like metal-dependent hydrolase (beta-lactamase superfamily II)
MKIHRIETGGLQCNCYLLEKDGWAVLIDCAGNGSEILAVCARLNLSIAAILLTHGHIDHIEGIDAVVEKFGCSVYIHKEDATYLKTAAYNLSSRIYMHPITICADAVLFEDQERIEIAGMTFDVIHTPGHTRGSVCFVCEDVLFTGDTLFLESVGNEFPPFGNFEMEIRSIKDRLFVLEEDYVCYPGHGPETSLFHEKKFNLYCRV